MEELCGWRKGGVGGGGGGVGGRVVWVEGQGGGEGGVGGESGWRRGYLRYLTSEVFFIFFPYTRWADEY